MQTSLIQNNLRFKVTKYNRLYLIDLALRLTWQLHPSFYSLHLFLGQG